MIFSYLKEIRSIPLNKRYLMTILVTCYLPLSILLVFVFFSLFTFIENQVYKSAEEQTAALLQSMDSKLSAIEKEEYRLSEVIRGLSTGSIAKDYDAFLIDSELKKFNYDDYVYDIVISFNETNRVFTTRGTFTDSSYLDDFYTYDNGVMLSEMLSYEQDTIVPQTEVMIGAGTTKQFVTFVYPQRRYSGATILFLIDMQLFANIEGSFLQNYEHSYIISNGAGDNICIVNNLNVDIVSFNESKSSLLDQSSAVQHNDLLPISYFYSMQQSRQSGWILTTFLKEEDVLNELNSLLLLSFIMFVAVVTVGLILSIVSSNSLYKPLFSLKKYAEKLDITTDATDNNAVDYTKNVIRELSDTAVALSERLKGSYYAQKNFLVQNLLRNRFSDIEEFNEIGLPLNVKIEISEYIAVFQIRCNELGVGNTEGRICKELEWESNSRIKILSAEKIERGIVVAVCFFKDRDSYIESIEAIKARIEETLGVKLYISSGNIKNRFEDIAKSFAESEVADEYNRLHFSSNVICYESLRNSAVTELNYPKQYMSLLKEALEKGSTESAVTAIENVFNNINNDMFSMYLARCVCYDLISCVISGFLNTGLEATYVTGMVNSIISYDNFEELKVRLIACCTSICNDIRAIDKKDELSVEKINLIIEQNYAGGGVTEKNIAAMFNVSPSYLSHYYKNATSTNLSAVIQDKRIEYAKFLLLNTNDAVKDISTKVGYFETSNFIRCFKKKTGTTPVKFRQNHNFSNGQN